ncbi:flagellar protein FlaG [Metabacillus schmidteae]|uniref:flagellar protein FlaG n=1 Tax=Metabacillus schmidteae TaxID=2730405 RepID=UPI00158D21BC|nr:flagellar protein FlaG [Metabacillus schmidteae]
MSIDKITSQLTLHNTEQTKWPVEKRDSESNNLIENKVIQNEESLKKIVKSLNDFLQPTNTHIKFELHEELNKYYVTVVDNQTNEVIKEIPSKKILDIYSEMKEFMGILFDKKI